jgi:hypothetical protein
MELGFGVQESQIQSCFVSGSKRQEQHLHQWVRIDCRKKHTELGASRVTTI